jgi:CDP-6-deoxy-D-xylo-4-hexulose-3-dehydrase
MNNDAPEQIEQEILALVERYYRCTRRDLPADKVPVTGKIYDQNELINLVQASLEGWWTDGRWGRVFEDRLREFLGVRFVTTVNSGSSANLIAMKTLASPKLGERRIGPGDEVITAAAGFPTTINPILDVGAVPVFVDVELGTYNVSLDELEAALSPKTKAIFLAHTLGNPFDLQGVKRLCARHGLWFVEDNCDALGSRYNGRMTGTFGDLATLSFYPAHHITTAEGGAVLTSDPLLHRIARSLRDWGRDCWCATGRDDTCGRRFMQQFGELPLGYDHKYVFSEIGYNLKMTDLQAALGAAQMDKLPGFVATRKENFARLSEGLRPFAEDLILPCATANSDPAWFGLPLTLRRGRSDRTALVRFLNDRGIATRLLFCGNVIRQPYFLDNAVRFRAVGPLANTDAVMNDTFWIGVYPGLGRPQIEYTIKQFGAFFDYAGYSANDGLKGADAANQPADTCAEGAGLWPALVSESHGASTSAKRPLGG